MKKILFTGVFVALAGLQATGETAETIGSGNYWNDQCNGNANAQFQCMLYTVGVVNGIQVAAAGYKHPTPFCFPENVTNGQLSDVFAKYLRDHPEKRHIASSWLVSNAMIEAFPCK